MNPATAKEAETLARTVVKGVRSWVGKGVDVVLCVPTPWLDTVRTVLRRHRSAVQLGAQDCFWQGVVGPHTGSVSAVMLADRGVEYVVIGHSERRREYTETNEQINGKVRAALSAGLSVILAVGDETRDDNLKTVISDQLRGALNGVSKKDIKRVTVAYEPVWAISTTENAQPATPDDALTGVMVCRKVLGDLTSRRQARGQRVMYGGSVTPQTIASYVIQDGVDGVLPGGASLHADQFITIVEEVFSQV